MDNPAPTVFIVDDDPSIRRSLARLLGTAGYGTRTFSSAQEFLESGTGAEVSCLVLDLQLPGPSGLDLQEALASSGRVLPIVFITGHGDIPASVRAMKAGAVDFLPKPFEPRALLSAVAQAVARGQALMRERAESRGLEERLGTLTAREKQVFARVAAGKLNKQVAAELGTTEKTIKVHRSRVVRKMGAGSLSELVRMAEKLGLI